MLLSSEIQLMPDKTFFIQLGIFLVVAVCLNYLVFKPVLKIIQLRKSKTEGDRKKIHTIAEKTEQLMKEYEAKMETAKKEAFKLKESLKREGEEQGQKVIHEAKQASLTQIDQIKKEIAVSSDRALKDLEEQSKTLGKNLAEKVLGRPIN